MARVTEKSVTGASASNWIPLNHHVTPFNVGFGVTRVGAGTMTFTVQHTFDDVLGGASATAFDHSDVSGKTASIDGNYAYPVKAVRLNVTAASGTSVATLKIMQSDV